MNDVGRNPDGTQPIDDILMSRPRRHCAPSVVYHVISRFVAHEFFIGSEAVRREYLTLLGRALTFTTWRCLGYAIMSNHIHLAMVAGTDPLAGWLRRAHTPFAEAINRSLGRIGAIFVRGPKTVLIPDGAVGAVLAYIHNNPVRAGVSARPRDSTWTSHRAYLGAPAPAWLDIDEGLRRARAVRGELFDQLVNGEVHHPILGEANTDEALEARLLAYERARSVERRRGLARPALAATHLVALVAHDLGMPIAQLRSRRKGQLEVLGRAVVIACGVHLGCPTSEVADALTITPQAVTKRQREAPAREVAAIARRLLEQIARGRSAA